MGICGHHDPVRVPIIGIVLEGVVVGICGHRDPVGVPAVVIVLEGIVAGVPVEDIEAILVACHPVVPDDVATGLVGSLIVIPEIEALIRTVLEGVVLDDVAPGVVHDYALGITGIEGVVPDCIAVGIDEIDPAVTFRHRVVLEDEICPPVKIDTSIVSIEISCLPELGIPHHEHGRRSHRQVVPVVGVVVEGSPIIIAVPVRDEGPVSGGRGVVVPVQYMKLPSVLDLDVVLAVRGDIHLNGRAPEREFPSILDDEVPVHNNGLVVDIGIAVDDPVPAAGVRVIAAATFCRHVGNERCEGAHKHENYNQGSKFWKKWRVRI